jgi:hypothetical protein
VSGERVVLAAGSAPLVTAAGDLSRLSGVRTVVIGGLAVICRLQRAHRATGDVDTATDGLDSLSLVVRIPGASLDGTDITMNGVTVQVIDTYELGNDVTDIEPETARLFVVGHRYAWETAEPVRVTAGAGADEVLEVATPAALLATKAHALADRHESAKRASDTTDIIGLLDTSGDSIIEALLGAPHSLGALVARSMRRSLIDDAARRARELVAFGDADWALPADQIASVARRVCDELD